jgi:hypothetical protein
MHAGSDSHRSGRLGLRPPILARAARIPLAILLLVLELPLILNPGYFSHDELQWWARADVPLWDLPWVSWLDLSPLQYRPLTFNLWLVLAHAFAATPRLMHLVFVALGTANAWLLARVLANARVPARTCYAAALVFALSPYAVYVHGWTGTLADLLTLALLLVGVRLVQRGTTPGALGAALAVAIALLCKESAVVLPALLALAAYGQPSARTTRLAVALSAAIAIAYLALRLPILADSGAASPAYAWSPDNIPHRAIEYLLYPFTPPLFEISSLANVSLARLAAAGACVALLLLALASRNLRWPAAWLAAFFAALAPVLVLPSAYGQYAYLASALGVAIAGAAWAGLRAPSRAIMCILAAIVVVHGTAVMWRMHAAGAVERNLHADLIEIVRREPATPIVVAAADPRDAWLVERLLHEVDRYRGVPLLNVRAAGNGDSPPGARRLTMGRDGHLAINPTP